MYLLRRPTTLADFEPCFAITRNNRVFSAAEKMALQELWSDLFHRKIGLSSVLEDTDCPVEDRIVAFGLSAFVKKPFIDTLATAMTACVIESIWEWRRRGESPFLSIEQIRRANSGEGLCSVTIQYGHTKREHYRDEGAAIRHQLVESFINTHSGYRLNCHLHEVYGGQEKDRLLDAGWRLENDFARFLEEGRTKPEDDKRPFLMKIAPHDVSKSEFSRLYPLFNYQPPRFHLSASQQALLKLTMYGMSDIQCAADMDVSIDTVHKRWRAIYERVDAVDPVLLGPAGESKRGMEKRTVLRRYLQAHPEELRPHMKSAGR